LWSINNTNAPGNISDMNHLVKFLGPLVPVDIKNDTDSMKCLIGMVQSMYGNNINSIFNGFCLPTTCAPRDVSNALKNCKCNKLLDNFYTLNAFLLVLYPITITPIDIYANCDYSDKPVVYNSYQLTAM